MARCERINSMTRIQAYYFRQAYKKEKKCSLAETRGHTRGGTERSEHEQYPWDCKHNVEPKWGQNSEPCASKAKIVQNKLQSATVAAQQPSNYRSNPSLCGCRSIRSLLSFLSSFADHTINSEVIDYVLLYERPSVFFFSWCFFSTANVVVVGFITQ